MSIGHLSATHRELRRGWLFCFAWVGGVTFFYRVRARARLAGFACANRINLRFNTHTQTQVSIIQWVFRFRRVIVAAPAASVGPIVGLRGDEPNMV